MKQFVKKKRKHPAAVGKAIVKKEGVKPVQAEVPGEETQAEKQRKAEAEEKKEEIEDEKQEETTDKEVEGATMPVLTEKASTSEIEEEQKEEKEQAESPSPTSQEQAKMAAAKFLPRRFSQELPSDLFEAGHSLSRPASRATFPSRPMSRTSLVKPLQSPSTEDTAERRPSKHCLSL